MKSIDTMTPCPCGNDAGYAACCGPLHDGKPAESAEQLMRSRYSAYVLLREDYLLASWHADTLLHAFAAARTRPFGRWLHALGAPASGTAPLTDWRTVAARSDDQWQATAGIGAGRAQHLVQFFRHTDVRALATHLHALGVTGF
jgi:NAD-dependent DNA ligase